MLGEVGAKDPRVAVVRRGWAADAAADLAAGATWVVTEGRESGTVGLFDPDGEVRADVVDAVVGAVGVDAHRVRGAAQGPAGLADPPLRRRREPRQRRPRRRARARGAAPRAARRHLRRTRDRRTTHADEPLPRPLPRGVGHRRRRRRSSSSRCARCSPRARSTAARGSSSCATADAAALVEVRKSTSEPACSATSTTSRCSPARTRPCTCTGRTSTPACPSELVKAAPDAPRCALRRRRGPLRPRQLRPRPRPRCGCTCSTSHRPGRPSCSTRSSACCDTAEDLPAIAVVRPRRRARATCCRSAPAEHYLLQCRGGGMDVPGRDRRLPRRGPTARADWTLLGCARSRAIHDHFYGDGRVTGAQIDTCPRVAGPRRRGRRRARSLLTKCCLLEEHIETERHTVVVPWGASFSHLREALEAAVGLAGPAAVDRGSPTRERAHRGLRDVRAPVGHARPRAVSSTSAARLQGWLDVLAALARAQAAEGLVPAAAAEQITARRAVELLDLDLVAEQTRATGHSTLGLIRALRAGAARGRAPARLRRRHRAGPHRHLDLARAARRSAARSGATCARSRSCCSTSRSVTATP